MAPAVEIRNRIRGTRRLLGREFNLTGLNHRLPGDGQEGAVKQSLEEIGKADAVLIYDSPKHGPNTLINGHKRTGWYPDEEWTAIVLDLTDAEAYRRIKDHDAQSALAIEDDDLLADLEAGILAEEQEAAELAKRLEEQDAAELAAAGANGNGSGELDVNPLGDNLGGVPPSEFPEVNEGLPIEYTCPQCSYQWSGRA